MIRYSLPFCKFGYYSLIGIKWNFFIEITYSIDNCVDNSVKVTVPKFRTQNIIFLRERATKFIEDIAKINDLKRKHYKSLNKLIFGKGDFVSIEG